MRRWRLPAAIGAVAGHDVPLGPFSFGWRVLLAGVLAMILTGLLAIALDALLFKRLRRHGTAITLVIASFGAAMALRSLLEFVFSAQPTYFSRAIQFAIPLGLGIRVTPDQMAMLALTALLVALMHLVMTRTGIGRAMRAVSENPALAEVAGIDVSAVVRATWMIGGALACAAGVMAGITVQVRPYMGFDLLLPLFSAAILGGIGSVPGAVIGGLIVGVAQSGAVHFVGAEFRAAVAFLILIAVLLVRPTGLFGTQRLMLDLLGYGAFFLATALIYGVFCLGLNLQWGQTGLFNVGVAGFAAIGAYTSALLTTPETAGRFGGFEMPIAVGWLGAMVASGLAAALIGAVTLRLRADYLAIATFGVAVCIQLLALNLESLTGGPFGIGFIPRPFASLQGDALSFNLANLALVAAVTIAVYFALERLDPQSLGARASRHPRGRGGRGRARQEPLPLPPAGLRARQRHPRARRRDAGAFHRLHRAGKLPLGAHLPGLGDAHHRRLRQQSRRDPRRDRRLGLLDALRRAGRGDCSRRVPGAQRGACRSSRSAWRSPRSCCFGRAGCSGSADRFPLPRTLRGA